MGIDATSVIAVAAAVALAALIVAIVVAASAGACCAGGAVHDVERAVADATTLMTYEQARRAAGAGKSGAGGDEEAPRCALCLSEFAGGDKDKAGGELVRVVSACGHFFHAGCGVEGWLRARGTCPLCRAEVWTTTTTLPRPPRPGGAGAAVGSR